MSSLLVRRTLPTWTVALVSLLLVAAGKLGAADPIDVLMAQKLESAQNVLEGLALEDFGEIARESQKLHLLSQESGWNVLQTAEYARLSAEFRKATEQLKKAADKENLDAAAVAYVKLTFNCIECHRHVRDNR